MLKIENFVYHALRLESTIHVRMIQAIPTNGNLNLNAPNGDIEMMKIIKLDYCCLRANMTEN